MREAQGFLLLKLTEHQPSDNFDVYMHEDKLCSIIEGVYISLYAQSILKDNAELIDSLMLDTTWEVMDKYVTSILVAVSYKGLFAKSSKTTKQFNGYLFVLYLLNS